MEIILREDEVLGRSIKVTKAIESKDYSSYLCNTDIKRNINKGKKALKNLENAKIDSLFSLANLFNGKFVYMNESLEHFSHYKAIINSNNIIMGENEKCIRTYEKLLLLTIALNKTDYEIENNVKLKDFNVDFTKLNFNNTSYIRDNYSKLPITSQKFSEYILEINIEDIVNSFSKIGSSSGIANTIKIIDDYINNKEDVYTSKESMRNATELLGILYETMIESEEENAIQTIWPYTTVSEEIFNNFNKHWHILILLDYFKKYKDSYKKYDYTYSHLSNTLNVIFGATNQWFKGSTKNSENIMKEFYKKSNSKYVLDVIGGVRQSNKALTETQWRSIMENYQDYENMPSDWLVEML